MKVRRYSRGAQIAGELCDELIDVALLGWAAPARPTAEGYDPFKIFTYRDMDLAAVWRRHEGTLRREARRRHLAPRYPTGNTMMFYAERLLHVTSTAHREPGERTRRGRSKSPSPFAVDRAVQSSTNELGIKGFR